MKHVLLIEDDPFLRDLTSSQLTSDFITVHSAHSAEAADTILNSTEINLILLDLELPGMSGLEYLELLKSKAPYQNIPVIVFSNNDDTDEETKCKQMGVAAYFVKIKTDYDDLRKKVHENLQ